MNEITEFSFGDIHYLLKDITLLCLYIAKLEQLESKKVFVGALLTRTI